MPLSIMLDSSFVISLVTPGERNHEKADKYFRYFVAENIAMQISAIVVSELELSAQTSVLPEKLFIFPPFNVEHAQAASDLAALFRQEYSPGGGSGRAQVKDDTKIIAQALLLGLDFLISSDDQMVARCEWLRTVKGRALRAINLNTDFSLQPFVPADGQGRLF